MRWSLLAAWFALLAIGGLSAMLFWSSFNRIAGGFGTGRDFLWSVVGVGGVLLVLLLARWVLGRIDERGEVEQDRARR